MHKLFVAVFAALALFAARPAVAMPEPLVYQGFAEYNGQPANGVYDFIFTLYDSPSALVPLAPSINAQELDVVKGLFTAQLGFDPALFDGSQRWLEIEIRPEGGGSYQLLAPRQRLGATPLAYYALAGAGEQPEPRPGSTSGLPEGSTYSLTVNDNGFLLSGFIGVPNIQTVTYSPGAWQTTAYLEREYSPGSVLETAWFDGELNNIHLSLNVSASLPDGFVDATLVLNAGQATAYNRYISGSSMVESIQVSWPTAPGYLISRTPAAIGYPTDPYTTPDDSTYARVTRNGSPIQGSLVTAFGQFYRPQQQNAAPINAAYNPLAASEILAILQGTTQTNLSYAYFDQPGGSPLSPPASYTGATLSTAPTDDGLFRFDVIYTPVP